MGNRKLLLASVRQGNYAHAGEEEAIELAMGLLPKKPEQTLLDVGCGLGGTAYYIQQHGWGEVSGIDIDPEVLAQAKKFYPNLSLSLCDANHVTELFLKPSFDAVYSFNAFFCFLEQENVLVKLNQIAKNSADLIIFDYASPDVFSKPSFFHNSTGKSTSSVFSPINLRTIEFLLDKTGWRLQQIIDLEQQYKNWYETLVIKMDAQKSHLITSFGEVTFNDLFESYRRLLDALHHKEITGVILHAKKK